MDQIQKLIASLSIRQRITIVAIALAVAGGAWAFSQWQSERNFKPLYTSLAAEDAGAVVQKLKQSGVEYRLSENGATILAPAARIAELRLEMAGAGLPKTGRIGFELFDKTSFGTSEFTEQVNYRRALEGELERSIISLSEVEQARVHLTFPKDSVFVESRQPAKASVLLRLRTGAQITKANVIAVTHLVASAVEGLQPEAVSVMDMRGNLLNRPRQTLGPDGTAPSEAMLDYQQKIERDVITKINTTLEPLLGPERFRAGVSVDCDFSSGEQSEETFDPTHSVMATSQKTEDEQRLASAGGVPGTASNLPKPPEKAGGSTTGTARRTESITYQTSRTMRHVKLPQGNVKRVSVALLIDQPVTWEGSGKDARRIIAQHSPEKIKTIHDLVAAAIGLNPARGDQLTIESLAFETTLNPETPVMSPGTSKRTPQQQQQQQPKNWWEDLLAQPKMLAIAGAGVGVFLLLLIGTVWMMKRSRRKKAAVRVEAPAQLAAAAAHHAGELEAPLVATPAAVIESSRFEVLTNKARQTAAADAAVCATVLRAWMTEKHTS